MGYRVIRSDATSDGTLSLQHYGVLGMKWGVRRTPEQLGHHTIPKGTTMYRTTVNTNESTKGSTYVTYLEPDIDHYRAWAAGPREGKDLYEKTYTLKQDLTVPSRKELTNVVYDVIKKDIDGKFLKEVAQTKYSWLKDNVLFLVEDWEGYFPYQITDKIWEETYDDKTGKNDWQTREKMIKKYADQYLKPYADEFVNKMSKESANDLMSDVTMYFAGATKTRQAVIDELKKRGYNAMVDEASVGGERLGRIREGVDPLIVFDQEDVLTKTNTRRVDKDEQKQAQKRFEDWQVIAQQHSRNNQW